MHVHAVAPGQSITVAGREWKHPECPPLSAADVALYLKMGVILPAPVSAPDSSPAPAEAPAPSSDVPSVPPPQASDDEGAGAPLVLPEKMPNVADLSEHLDGKSADYIRAMQEADGRSSAARFYKSALAGLEE